ncbi:Myb-like DNA-binding domain containing protein [Trichomonas vaginalis G3]|uniref:Myb-like DNA-binding domain containing protein n=1 Tax=Trichomonas vaginalis (strain ATCC PRA-98 / G3) TaxID=412133 RepID=A2FI44_TRIV3|nr:RNA polymerase II transcription regulator recruiting protein [Trichomonas vaginalis G3]EAX95431.1 Myb-like DNA-binding domain containing protein [Trichomonas vaginalis G3]KAI5532212.1 RNA polymerase II transcription regulator recruiting protein [Trichomonas vaginalis G3]|eukprot:XP_001308361.1 Myb-like DNA-binding domain containing protein [Trichomonas vaginalis G3]
MSSDKLVESKIVSRTDQTRRGKNKFTINEDAKLQMLVKKYGESDWSTISQILRSKNARQCHDRWFYYLSPKLNRGPFTEDEDQKLIKLEKKYGQHWVRISKHFSGRTDTQIKNRWNVLKRRLESEKSINIPTILNPTQNIIPQSQQVITQNSDPISQRMFDNLFELEGVDQIDDPFASVF